MWSVIDKHASTVRIYSRRRWNLINEDGELFDTDGFRTRQQARWYANYFNTREN